MGNDIVNSAVDGRVQREQAVLRIGFPVQGDDLDFATIEDSAFCIDQSAAPLICFTVSSPTSANGPESGEMAATRKISSALTGNMKSDCTRRANATIERDIASSPLVGPIAGTGPGNRHLS